MICGQGHSRRSMAVCAGFMGCVCAAIQVVCVFDGCAFLLVVSDLCDVGRHISQELCVTTVADDAFLGYYV